MIWLMREYKIFLNTTIKGPNSLGNRNSKNISAAYRGLHYSFIGRVDLTVCGNSDRLGRAA